MCPLVKTSRASFVKHGKGPGSIRHYNFAQWLRAEIDRRGISLRSVARQLGYPNASRITEYLQYRRVPTAEMVRRLADAIGLSPIEALWRAGYDATLLLDLVELYTLGWSWCREDRVHLDPRSGAVFLGYASVGEDLSTIPEPLTSRYHSGAIFNTQTNSREIREVVVLPRPMAAAIFIAVGLFPRRGDKAKPSTMEFIHALASLTSPMIKKARASPKRGELLTLPPTLQQAQLAAEIPGLDMSSRGALIAEHVNDWANSVSSEYAHYARLALYELGGEMYHFIPESINRWEYMTADFPNTSDFKMANSTVP